MKLTDEDVLLEESIHVSFGSKLAFKRVMSEIRKEYPKRWNRYGTSANGYAYSCGHEWDCCGCLSDVGRREYQIVRDGLGVRVDVLQDCTRNY